MSYTLDFISEATNLEFFPLGPAAESVGPIEDGYWWLREK